MTAAILKNLVTATVAERVVDGFEVVKVKIGNRERVLNPATIGDQITCGTSKSSGVGHARERVGRCEDLLDRECSP